MRVININSSSTANIFILKKSDNDRTALNLNHRLVKSQLHNDNQIFSQKKKIKI